MASTNQRKYDVFLSFRGEDTRTTFTRHLYEALKNRGIKTFIESEKLRIGDAINDELMKAIEESSCSIIVLSKVYASSKWCLRELAKIMDCKLNPEMKQVVLPVFYHVDPSDVQNQSGSFKKDFDTHETTPEIAEDVLRWRAAMAQVGKLRGFSVNHHNNEAAIIEEITKFVLHTLHPEAKASKRNYLVGIDSWRQQMGELLALESPHEVRFVGIVGMGGIGKTTLAEFVYDEIACEFRESCFLRIVGGTNGTKPSLLELQRQLLRKLLSLEDNDISNEDDGAAKIRAFLRHKKVLLVLDGVDNYQQLEKLGDSPNYFARGSRIIVTTRNKRLLSRHNMGDTVVYNVELMNRSDALKLFCWHAFRKDDVPDDQNHRKISHDSLKCAGGLPLALECLGSVLRSKGAKALRNPKEMGEYKRMLENLKSSYSDSLEIKTLEVFLDVACFFKGKNKDRVIKILESLGHKEVRTKIDCLIDICLMDVSHDGTIVMHDIIQDMGRQILRQESSSMPSKQSRIWHRQDFEDVSDKIHVLKYIRGIVLDLDDEQEDDEQEELVLEAVFFSRMTNLRILEISHVQVSGHLEYLSNLLGFLNWPGCPLEGLPSTFESDYLSELQLPRSNIIRLWEGEKKFGKLKAIDLSYSESLSRTPNLSMVQNLERLVLRGCIELSEIHPSVSQLHNLVLLDLQDCTKLKTFSSTLSCRKLKTFILSGCSSLVDFPVIVRKHWDMEELCLDGTAIEKLDPSIELLIDLVFLNLSGCRRLSTLPSEIANLRSLKTLNLNGCSELVHIKQSLGNSVEKLDISGTAVSDAERVEIAKMVRLQASLS